LSALSLILVDRRGDVDLARVEQEARGSLEPGRVVEVVRLRPGADAPGGDVSTGGARAHPSWSAVILDGLASASHERAVVLDAAALAHARGALALADELDGAGAVAARLLEPGGDVIAFDGGAFSASDGPYSPAAGARHAERPGARRPSLYFDGRAFAVRRSALLALDPPDDEVAQVLADVDWGWRLSLAGHPVVTSAVVALPLADGHEGEAVPAPLRERATAGLLVQCLGDARLPSELHLTPEQRERRAHVQRERLVGDERLFALVGDPGPVRRVAGGAAGRRRRRVGILCADTIGRSMAGPAIRAVEMARALGRDFDVVIGVRRLVPGADVPCRTETLTGETVDRLLRECDALVLQGELTKLFPQLLAADVPLAVDLYDPMNLEALEDPQADRLVPYTVDLLVEQVVRGDFFICASERQRDYWLGMLAAAGRITPELYAHDPDLRRLIDIVPFGTPPQPPVRTGPGVRGVIPAIGPDDPLFLWNGGLWDWFDPDTFVLAVAAARERVPTIRAYFMGVRHPHGGPEHTAIARRVFALSDRLGLTGRHVFFNDWTPYDTRHNVYLDATAIVSLHPAHLESRFSFRTRFLDGIWARVPMISTDGDVFAELVKSEGLGLTVEPGDVDGVAAAMETLAGDARVADAARERLRALAPSYYWENAVRPLSRWFEEPTRTSGAAPPRANGRGRPLAPRPSRRDAAAAVRRARRAVRQGRQAAQQLLERL
jgi:hypothetical protein